MSRRNLWARGRQGLNPWRYSLKQKGSARFGLTLFFLLARLRQCCKESA